MTVYEYGRDIIPARARSVALGFFDGMHLAHKELISLAVAEAHREGLSPTVFTFSSEERGAKRGAPRLSTTEEKLRVMEALGVCEVVVATLARVGSVPAPDFVKNILVGELSCAVGVVGYNFRFGRGAEGDAEFFSLYMKKCGCRAVIMEEKRAGDSPLSATALREALAEGDTERARALIGEPFSVFGKVERGLGLGRSFGFPTVNLPLPDGSPLRTGVYRSCVKIGERLYHGVTNVGVCPSVDRVRGVHAETFIIGFSGQLYGEKIRVYLLGYLRDEKKFERIEELSEQIARDAERTLLENGENLWAAIGQN